MTSDPQRPAAPGEVPPDQPAAYLGSAEEPCPDCGGDPEDDDLHQEGCRRVGTCGQIGPPWVAVLHAEPAELAPAGWLAWYQAHVASEHAG